MENKKAKIDIILPNFNSSDYIKETIKSVIKQTYTNWNLIIVDDCSDEKTVNILKKYQKNKKFKIYFLKKNQGAGYCRNYAIKKSKSPFIAFLDSDDIWKKRKLEKQILFMNNNNIDFSYTSYNQIDKNGNKIKTIFAPKYQTYRNLLEDCKIGLSTVIIRKKILRNSLRFPNLKTKEDLYLWLQLSKKNKLIGYGEVLSDWRKLDDSLSSNTLQKILDGFRLYYVHEGFNIFKSIYYLFLLSFNYIKKNI